LVSEPLRLGGLATGLPRRTLGLEHRLPDIHLVGLTLTRYRSQCRRSSRPEGPEREAVLASLHAIRPIQHHRPCEPFV